MKTHHLTFTAGIMHERFAMTQHDGHHKTHPKYALLETLVEC